MPSLAHFFSLSQPFTISLSQMAKSHYAAGMSPFMISVSLLVVLLIASIDTTGLYDYIYFILFLSLSIIHMNPSARMDYY